MYCKIIDGQEKNITKHEVEGSVRLELLSPSPIDLIDKQMVGYKYKIKSDVVIGIPVFIELSKKEKAKNIRKIEEQDATIIYNSKEIQADDKAISMLQAYIQAGTNEMPWKCLDNSWIVLTASEMLEVHRLIALKKKELFEKEFMETI
jgi:hypothetical protein